MQILIEIIGSVALLVWGTYMIRTGMLRTFGEDLRQWLSVWLKNRFSGISAGFVLSSLLQSSTASALLVSGLQAKGLVTTLIALSCVLGADVGSAFMVRLLSLDLSLVAPVLTAAGVFLFLRNSQTKLGQFGRILLGLSFVMMALSLIVSATMPIRSSQQLVSIFSELSNYLILSVSIGFALALVCFSSLAVVMITAGIVVAGVLPVSSGLWVVLGANLGSAFLAVLTTAASGNVARRAPVGNCIFRVAGFLISALLLTLFPGIEHFFVTLSEDAVIYFHLAFNIALCTVGLFFLAPVSRWVEKWLPENKKVVDSDIRFLTQETLQSSTTALKLAKQEIQKTVHFVSEFWEKVPVLLQSNPPAGEIMLMRNHREMIKRRCKTISRYLTELMQCSLTTEEALEWQRLQNDNANVGYCAELVDTIIARLEKKKCRLDRYFSPEGAQELMEQQQRLAKNLKSLGQYLGNDDSLQQTHAKLLLQKEKRAMAAEEFSMIERHMNRVIQGQTKAVETSALHVEILTLFRRFNALICSTADTVE